MPIQISIGQLAKLFEFIEIHPVRAADDRRHDAQPSFFMKYTVDFLQRPLGYFGTAQLWFTI